MNKRLLSILLCILLIPLISCSDRLIYNDQVKGASEYTKRANENVYRDLNFSDKSEFNFASQGLIDSPDKLTITDKNGEVIWSQDAYSFVTDSTPSPDSVNPSLWSNTQMNHYYGLFELGKGIYQVRGYDITNLTVVKGLTGYIVIDPMSNSEASKASMDLVYKNIGHYPIVAIILTSPNLNTYGGIKGIVSEDEIKTKAIPVIAPRDFTEYAITQNIFVKDFVSRQKDYENGMILDKNEIGALSVGLGFAPNGGSISFIEPNTFIVSTGEERTIDGIKISFQVTSDSASAVALNIFFPDKKALYVSENCSSTLENLYDLSSGKIRDAKSWASFLTETIALYKDSTEVVFQAHNWPHFGKDAAYCYLLDTACIYKLINDQTLSMINQGMTKEEIIANFKLPQNLYISWYLRQYTTSISKNISAVYEKYAGCYDGNPINLNPLSQSQSARKFVDYMGDPNEILKRAGIDFYNGEYQWVAEVTNVLILADPSNQQAKFLCADALEQLGYQSESSSDRNSYLSAAKELREGKNPEPAKSVVSNSQGRSKLSSSSMLDLLSIRLDSKKLESIDLKTNLILTDTNEKYLLHLKDGVLLYYSGINDEGLKDQLSMPKNTLLSIIDGNLDAQKSNITISGDTDFLKILNDNMITFNSSFDLIG